MARHNLKRGVTRKRPRLFLGGIERLEARTLLAGAEMIGAGESDSKPTMPLHDAMQVAAPAYVRQVSIAIPKTVSQLPETQQTPDLQFDDDVTEEATQLQDKALEEWDQDETRTAEQTDRTDRGEEDNDSLFVTTDELTGTGGVDAEGSTHTDSESPILPLLASTNGNHSNASNTSASAMIRLAIPWQVAGMPTFDSSTSSSTNDRGVFADHFHYFDTSTSRTETSTTSLASEPLSNYAARDTFMAMSMLKPSGIDNSVRASDPIPTTIVRTTRASQDQVSQINTQDVSQRKTVTPVRLGSLPMVTLLHSVMFAGQMALNSSADVLNLNQPHDDVQSARTDLPSPPIAMTTSDSSKLESDSESSIPYQNGLFLTVVCASLSMRYRVPKRTKLLQWTWLLVGNERTE